MLSVTDARERVLNAVERLPAIDARVGDALGLVTAADVVASGPLPRFDNSSMDGYAVRAGDVANASGTSPVELRLAGEVRAGAAGGVEVAPGSAVRIMTGAPLPPGADAVVPVEEADEVDAVVRVAAPTVPGRFVRAAGEDVVPGDVLVREGTELGAGEVALLAAAGVSPTRVIKRPRVAVVVTGDELVPPESTPEPGQIRDSNSIALTALVSDAGAELSSLDVVADERDAVVDGLARAAQVSDLVISSGGVAVGRFDYVKEAVERLRNIELWRVAMQPGKPLVLGTVGDTPFLGLPGNPVSVHIGFEQFARPAVRKMRGCRALLRPRIEATLTDALEKPAGRLHFVRVRLWWTGAGWDATPTGPQGSHIQSSLVGCHGVALFELEDTRLEPGSKVIVEVWELPS